MWTCPSYAELRIVGTGPLTPYTLRDPQRIIRQAKQHGAHLGRFTEALLSGTLPWAKLQQAQKLLRLGEKYGRHRLGDRARSSSRYRSRSRFALAIQVDQTCTCLGGWRNTLDVSSNPTSEPQGGGAQGIADWQV